MTEKKINITPENPIDHKADVNNSTNNQSNLNTQDKLLNQSQKNLENQIELKKQAERQKKEQENHRKFVQNKSQYGKNIWDPEPAVDTTSFLAAMGCLLVVAAVLALLFKYVTSSHGFDHGAFLKSALERTTQDFEKCPDLFAEFFKNKCHTTQSPECNDLTKKAVECQNLAEQLKALKESLNRKK
jgi:hypothetical protein